MKLDRLDGKTIRWTFADGVMAKKTFEHHFDEKGSLTFRSIQGTTQGKATEVDKYEGANVNADVCAVSYLSGGGYTLTAILDFKTNKLLAYSSNDKELALQHGTFEEVSV